MVRLRIKVRGSVWSIWQIRWGNSGVEFVGILVAILAGNSKHPTNLTRQTEIQTGSAKISVNILARSADHPLLAFHLIFVFHSFNSNKYTNLKQILFCSTMLLHNSCNIHPSLKTCERLWAPHWTNRCKKGYNTMTFKLSYPEKILWSDGLF